MCGAIFAQQLQVPKRLSCCVFDGGGFSVCARCCAPAAERVICAGGTTVERLAVARGCCGGRLCSFAFRLLFYVCVLLGVCRRVAEAPAVTPAGGGGIRCVFPVHCSSRSVCLCA
ncbi:hypothetical protein TCDM_10035 [Trypanosoma cruzi Dm28c]|uniref:Uncharacterized protein n=1 Tax=Trypanosoma cruzi Dm28c TaxID=1416333 RepID=V5D4A4_TRYCR|nr:hypothetical protein TCDM_10035 [Trypanosoma cruzi Dm28c]